VDYAAKSLYVWEGEYPDPVGDEHFYNCYAHDASEKRYPSQIAINIKIILTGGISVSCPTP
jgi:hypothetical protein